MKMKTVPIDSVRADPSNARRHGERNLEQIKASLRRFKQQLPIVVDQDMVVRAGNGRLVAARALGWTEIQVVVSDLPLSELRAFAIADNRTAELAEWDEEVLAATLQAMQEEGEDVSTIGFDQDEVDALLAEPEHVDESTDTRQLSKNNKSAVVRVAVLVPDLAVVEQAIARCENPNRGECLVEICRAYVKAAEG